MPAAAHHSPRFSARLSLRPLVVLAACLWPVVLAACNPLVFQDIADGAHVREFTLKGTLNAPVHSGIAVPYDIEGDGLHDHLLLANGEDSSLAWMELSEAGFALGEFPDADVLSQLIFPIERADLGIVGGLAKVPDPMAAPGEAQGPYGLVSLQAPSTLERARVVRFRIPEFSRVDDVNLDIVNVRVNGTLLPRFGRQLAAINLDADQLDPDYEVLVGSELGVAVFDNLGKNRLTYTDAREAAETANPGSTTGDNAPDYREFTFCEDVGLTNAVAAGLLGAGQSPVFIAANADGLTFIAEQQPPATNAAGAPIYDCARRTISAPTEGTEDFGAGLLIADIDGDGLDDLAVGDPGANRVFIYLQDATNGLGSTPVEVLEPFDDEDGETTGFGASIGVARLGDPIGDVLLVGAPTSPVGQTRESGRFFVFDRVTREPISAVLDTEPGKNDRWGRWVGGLSVGERQEIVVHGTDMGRVHVAINEDDPRP